MAVATVRPLHANTNSIRCRPLDQHELQFGYGCISKDSACCMANQESEPETAQLIYSANRHMAGLPNVTNLSGGAL
eukprot:359821-Chlamydomonas_euryale.AAC.9